MSDDNVDVIVQPIVVEIAPGDSPKIDLIGQTSQIDLVGQSGPTVEIINRSIHIDVHGTGVAGPPGPGAQPELYDSNIPNPPGAPATYLRFERDGDGDVQAIYLGTAT